MRSTPPSCAGAGPSPGRPPATPPPRPPPRRRPPPSACGRCEPRASSAATTPTSRWRRSGAACRRSSRCASARRRASTSRPSATGPAPCPRPSASSSSRVATTSCCTSPCPTPTRCTPSSSTGSPSAARWPTCARRSSTSTSAAPCSSRSVRIPEPENHCACAILAYVKAIAADAQVSSEQLAAELLELWHHLTRGARQELYGRIAALDISITQMKTLHALDACADEVSVKELARRPGLSLPGASRTVDGLLRRGWLERRAAPAARRMRCVAITPAGRHVIDRIETARLAGLEDYAAPLTPAQRATLSSALSNLPHRP